MFSFVDYLPLFTCIIADLVQEHAIVCELCWFTIHLAFHSPGPQIVSLRSHGLILWKNPTPFMVGWKVYFLWRGLPLSPIFAMDWFFGQTLHGWLKSIFFMTWFAVFAYFRPFLNKKCKKIWGRNGPIKKFMPYMDSSHSSHFIMWEKIFLALE